MKVLVCGHARHGKDTFCELLGLKFSSSSRAAMEYAIWPVLGPRYKDMDECFEDRVNRREEWYNLISEYNTPDKSRLARAILEHNDVYCGMRSREEFDASKHLFHLTIWVDAIKRLPPEDVSSNKLNRHMFDIVVNNNGTLDNLKKSAKLIRGTIDERRARHSTTHRR